MSQCYRCKSELMLPRNGPVSRHESCSKCGASVRCCRNCQFYDPSVYNECRETAAERLVEKDKSNSCDFFRLSKVIGAGQNSDPAAEAKRKLEDLFKK